MPESFQGKSFESMDSPEISQLKKRIQSIELELKSIQSALLEIEIKSTPSDKIPEKNKVTADDLIRAKVSEIQKEIKEPGISWDKWEFLLGGNWIAKIGFLAMLLAFGWFMDLAFRYEWIGDSGKIYFGLFSGFLFMFAGFYYAKQNYRILTPALVGTGASILYLTIFSSYRFYHFFHIVETFVYITILNLLLVFYAKISKSEVLYFFGYIGSILTPVLLSTGENSYKFLFSYLTICNLLFLYASRNLKWKWAPILVFLSNWLMLGVWMEQNISVSSFLTPFLFANFIGYLFLWRELFLEYDLSNHLIQSKLLIVGSLVLAGIFSYILVQRFYPSFESHSYLYFGFIGLFTLDKLQKKRGIDWNTPILFYLSTCLILFSLSSPSNQSFLSYSLVFLSSIYSLSYLKIFNQKNYHLKIASLFLWCLAILRIIFSEGLDNNVSKFLLNDRFLVYTLTTVSLSYLFFQFYKAKSENLFIFSFGLGALAISVIGFLWEIHYSVTEKYWRSLGYSTVLASYAAVLLFIGFYKSLPMLRRIGVVFAILVLGKFIVFDIWSLSLVTKIIAGFSIGLLLVILGLFYEKFKIKVLGDTK